jgi:predicted dinucleotide-binding enzyme
MAPRTPAQLRNFLRPRGEHVMTKGLHLALGRRDLMQLIAGAAGLGLAGLAPRAGFAQTGNLKSLKIATIGAGREGGAIGTLYAKEGHQVMFSSRNPDQLKELVEKAGPNASAGTVEQAIAFGTVVFLVVPYTAVEQIGRDHGTALAAKRVVIDVSNPIPRRDGEEFVKSVDAQGGPGVVTAKWLHGAKVVRALNAIGYNALVQNAHKPGEPIGVPIAGDDPSAIALASDLLKEIGYEPVLIGGLAMGKYLRPGTPLGGEHSAAEIRQIAATLK